MNFLTTIMDTVCPKAYTEISMGPSIGQKTGAPSLARQGGSCEVMADPTRLRERSDTVLRQDIGEVVAKFKAFHEGLTEGEQQMTAAIVQRAATAASDDVAGFAMDGISRLMAVTQMNANIANNVVLQAADKQRENIVKRQGMRQALKSLE
jgi:hypothetical protein